MKILAIISGRADGSPLRPVIRAVGKRDGLQIHEKRVEGWPASDVLFAVQHDQFRADLVLLLGDRYESLAAAVGATLAGQAIAHIHGGEATFGAIDNQMRDAITKLAHVHFVAHNDFRWRLNQRLGENHERIHVVGAPGLDNLVDLPPRQRTKTFICTYHPCTAVEENIEPLLEALDRFSDYKQIWTGVNNDPGSSRVVQALGGRRRRSFSPRDYLVACRNAAAVVGNSSSGIIEAPSLKVPSVDVGQRQAGRLTGPSVLSPAMDADAIEWALREAIQYDGPFDNPYYQPGASEKIADVLSSLEITPELRMKTW